MARVRSSCFAARRRLGVLFAAAIGCALVGRLFASDEEVSRVVILANGLDPDSLAIARHYAAVRGVPRENIVSLPLSSAETIAWPEFLATLWQPLLDELVRTRWVDAVPMATKDSVGRRTYASHSHRISALVVCRGVPLRLDHDPALLADSVAARIAPHFRTNAGAVDSELSLLAQPNYPINGLVANPLYAKERPSPIALGSVIKVGRLDGPTAADAMDLVDRAVAAERRGLRGRAYIDFSGRDPLGDRWLDAARSQLEAEPFDFDVDRAPGTFTEEARFDAPALYLGWYARDICGPMSPSGFRFAEGAIALHIHSYSAVSVRSSTAGWVGPLVARGVAATFGNVHEPFLQQTHRPDLLLHALLRGATIAEAAYFALPSLSWQAVVIGDPLYRPFARPANPAPAGKITEADTYATLASMRHSLAAGKRAEALAAGERELRKSGHLPLAVSLAELNESEGCLREARTALAMGDLPAVFSADQWGLARKAAALCGRLGLPARANLIWNRILASPGLPLALRQKWLPEAIAAAETAADQDQAALWRAEFASASSTAPN